MTTSKWPSDEDRRNRREPQLALSHLGFHPHGEKTVTLIPGRLTGLPDRIRFYVRMNGQSIPRESQETVDETTGFNARFPTPYEEAKGRLQPTPETYFYQGELVLKDSRWGAVWQADFSDFQRPGSYQIETDHQVSAPFMVADWVYDRLGCSFLQYLRAQRSGCDTPGIRPAANLDDGVRDDNQEPWPAVGGWYNAGDMRKWLSLTQLNLWTLCELLNRGHRGFADAAREEAAWGSRYFQSMCTDEGQVFEDTAGGAVPEGFDGQRDWWYENLPGCVGDASDNRWSDNVPYSGDERTVRTSYNPLVQFLFVQTQAQLSTCLPDAEGARCRILADRAWRYGQKRGHDSRTLFLAQELLAGVELGLKANPRVQLQDLMPLVTELLNRQQQPASDGLHGFFLEAHGKDAYRSAAYAAHPPLALLAFAEAYGTELPQLASQIDDALTRYAEGYLQADAHTNPFGLTPYGVYLDPPQADRQLFREAGDKRWVRTFMHPYNRLGIAHGTSSVLAGHAYFLARLSARLRRPDLAKTAEQQIHWLFGHNTLNRSTHGGIGYRQPAGYGYHVSQLPDAMIVGFIGWPDDTPYLEESFAIKWNTLEYWDVPAAWSVGASVWLPRR